MPTKLFFSLIFVAFIASLMSCENTEHTVKNASEAINATKISEKKSFVGINGNRKFILMGKIYFTFYFKIFCKAFKFALTSKIAATEKLNPLIVNTLITSSSLCFFTNS